MERALKNVSALQFNPQSLQKYARWLIWRSYFSLILWPIIGLVITYLIAENCSCPYPRIVMLIGLIFGYLLGSYRSICMRLRAQQSLCLMQIEENTKSINENQTPESK